VVGNIQVLKPGAESETRSLTPENQNRDGVEGLAWTPQGQIVFRSNSGQRHVLVEVDSNGSNSRRLAASDGESVFSDPAVSPRGDFIVAVQWSGNDVGNIWRVDLAGGDWRRLTTGNQDTRPSVTPDGQWVVYAGVQDNKSVLLKVPSQGGPAVRLTDYNADSPSVSPDGKWIACSHIAEQNQPPSLAIVPMAGGPPARVLPLPKTSIPLPLAWTPDGGSVAFINMVDGVTNIWQQPLAGGPSTPVTHFKLGKIFNFQWSHDGRIALARGTETVDAVLIRTFRDTSR
jgi:Tol biopolymer transport system component